MSRPPVAQLTQVINRCIGIQAAPDDSACTRVVFDPDALDRPPPGLEEPIILATVGKAGNHAEQAAEIGRAISATLLLSFRLTGAACDHRLDLKTDWCSACEESACSYHVPLAVCSKCGEVPGSDVACDESIGPRGGWVHGRVVDQRIERHAECGGAEIVGWHKPGLPLEQLPESYRDLVRLARSAAAPRDRVHFLPDGGLALEARMERGPLSKPVPADEVLDAFDVTRARASSPKIDTSRPVSVYDWNRAVAHTVHSMSGHLAVGLTDLGIYQGDVIRAVGAALRMARNNITLAHDAPMPELPHGATQDLLPEGWTYGGEQRGAKGRTFYVASPPVAFTSWGPALALSPTDLVDVVRELDARQKASARALE